MIAKVASGRERLWEYGVERLSEQELLAIILRTGTKNKSVTELAQALLESFGGLMGLKLASLEELQSVPGIGKIRATEICAMIRFSQLLFQSAPLKLGQVTSSHILGTSLIDELKDLQQEILIVIYLNTKNEIIKKETLFKGTLNQSIAHPREIYHGAVKCCAARFVLVHNHPSGCVEASQNDLSFTKRVKECGEMMGIELLDHLIIGDQCYLSLREEGVLF